jgi:hypothetical protein
MIKKYLTKSLLSSLVYSLEKDFGIKKKASKRKEKVFYGIK